MIPREAWSSRGKGEWEADQPLLSIGRPRAGMPSYTLSFPDDPDFRPSLDKSGRFKAKGDLFVVVGGRVLLRSVTRKNPPGDAVLGAFSVHQVRSDDGRWIVSGNRVGGEGFSVPPGESVDLTCDIPARSTLRFAICAEALSPGSKTRAPKPVFRVFLDGSLLFEESPEGEQPSVSWHSVRLPPEPTDGAKLRFEVTGPPTYTSFLDPVVGPEEIGSYGQRPFDAVGKDVVFFLADTFRSDNLAAYGGGEGRAPNIDRLCDESLLFRNMHSIATHTLPAHSSFFSGLFPRQNGIVDLDRPLPEEVDTLAEMFARRGYRTVAITDSMMVSQSRGMSQGFGWFDERRTDMGGTVARVREALAADDGRPLFLFVQSYANHSPYAIRESTRQMLGDRWSVGRSYKELLDSVRPKPDDPSEIDMTSEESRAAVRGLATMYAAAVFDMDRGFGEVRAELQASGILKEGHLLFTSDHGESLGQHDWLFHSGTPYEELLRVPFLILGPRAAPGSVDRPTSLIDLAPTLADLAGVPALPQWVGRSLLDGGTVGPLFAFQCRGRSNETSAAVLDGTHKWIGLEDRGLHEISSWTEAYDLQSDPTEQHDVLEGAATWPQAGGEKMLSLLRFPLTPLLTSEGASFSPDQLRELDAMGYGGESSTEE